MTNSTDNEALDGLIRKLNIVGDVGLVDPSKLNDDDFNAVLDAAHRLTALRSTTAEPVPAVAAEGDLPDDDWVPSPFTGNRLGTHPTDSAAKDAEIVEGEPVHPAEAIMYQQEGCIGRLEAQNLALCEALKAAANSLNAANVLIEALSGNKSIMVETQEERTRAALANRGEAGSLAKGRSDADPR